MTDTPDPHRATLDRFLQARDDLEATWWPKYGAHDPGDGRELDSHPLPPEYDPHADAHGDACPGDCGWTPCPAVPDACPGPDPTPARVCACGEPSLPDLVHTVTCCHGLPELTAP